MGPLKRCGGRPPADLAEKGRIAASLGASIKPGEATPRPTDRAHEKRVPLRGSQEKRACARSLPLRRAPRDVRRGRVLRRHLQLAAQPRQLPFQLLLYLGILLLA